MKHYTTTVQCVCGHRFSVCVHSSRLVASGKGFTVVCPMNASKIHVPIDALVPADSCPAGALVVRDDPTKPARW
jgi:hypothetical protein